MRARIARHPIIRRTAALHQQAQFLILMLGCVGVTGTALALCIMLAQRGSRDLSGMY